MLKDQSEHTLNYFCIAIDLNFVRSSLGIEKITTISHIKKQNHVYFGKTHLLHKAFLSRKYHGVKKAQAQPFVLLILVLLSLSAYAESAKSIFKQLLGQ